jgi:hypothetical protein
MVSSEQGPKKNRHLPASKATTGLLWPARASSESSPRRRPARFEVPGPGSGAPGAASAPARCNGRTQGQRTLGPRPPTVASSPPPHHPPFLPCALWSQFGALPTPSPVSFIAPATLWIRPPLLQVHANGWCAGSLLPLYRLWCGDVGHVRQVAVRRPALRCVRPPMGATHGD